MKANNNLPIRMVLGTLAFLAALHFMRGTWLMAIFIWHLPYRKVHYVLFSLPYVGLLVVFFFAWVYAIDRRPRLSALLLVVGLIVSAGLCAYDLTHGNTRAQMCGGGIGYAYAFWWWYYEPYWHGYKPGNV